MLGYHKYQQIPLQYGCYIMKSLMSNSVIMALGSTWGKLMESPKRKELIEYDHGKLPCKLSDVCQWTGQSGHNKHYKNLEQIIWKFGHWLSWYLVLDHHVVRGETFELIMVLDESLKVYPNYYRESFEDYENLF